MASTKRRTAQLTRASLIIALAALLSLPAVFQAPQPAPPNVVLILADDLGWGDIESNNPDSPMTTPHIDSIAKEGVKFTDAHSPSSVCSPTRYGLLTGRYAWRTWLQQGTIRPDDPPLISPDVPTIGTLLQQHRYRTAAIGKWHLGMDFSQLPLHETNGVNRGIDFYHHIMDGPIDHGFDQFFGTEANLFWKPHVYIRDRHFLANPEKNPNTSDALYEEDEVLDRLTAEAVSFIDQQSQTGQPFFLYLPLHTPHAPHIPSAQFKGQTGLGDYTVDTLVNDSIIQVITPDGEEIMRWNSFDHIPLEDCMIHWFPGDYAHINHVHYHDGRILASLRGCSTIVMIDAKSGETIWRLGRTNLTTEQYTERGMVEPMPILNDPVGEFCGQHSARMTGDSRILLFDNGVHCQADADDNQQRENEQFSRVVEYHIDEENQTATFLRHHTLHGQQSAYGHALGSVYPLPDGNWLIGWGHSRDDLPGSPTSSITFYDPELKRETLSISFSTGSHWPPISVNSAPIPNGIIPQAP